MSKSTPVIVQQIEAAIAQLYALMNGRQKAYQPSETDQSLTTYLQDATDEKRQLLLHHGFPELCVLAYFFQASHFHKDTICFSEHHGFVRTNFRWDAYAFLIDHHIVEPLPYVKSSQHAFLMNEKVMNVFPQLPEENGSKPYPVFWPTDINTHAAFSNCPQKYSVDEVRFFCKAAHNHQTSTDNTMRDKCFHAFLRIILTLPDDIETVIEKNMIIDEEIACQFTHFIKQRKNKWRLSMETSKEYHVWWNALSAEKMQSIYHECVRYYAHDSAQAAKQLPKIMKIYRDFCREMARYTIERVYVQLQDFTNNLRNTAGVFTDYCMGVYEPLLGFCDVYFNMCKCFFEKENTLTDDITQNFIESLSNMLKGMRAWPYWIDSLPEAAKEKFEQIAKDIAQAQELLRKCFYLTDANCFSEQDDFVLVNIASTLSCTQVLKTAPADLLHCTRLWLQKSGVDDHDSDACVPYNQLVVLNILNRVFEREFSTARTLVQATTQAASTVISGAVSLMSSAHSVFFSKRQTTASIPNHSFGSTHSTNSNSTTICRLQLRERLMNFRDTLASAQTPDEFIQVINDFLHSARDEMLPIKKQFVRGLLDQIMREAAAKLIVEHFQTRPALSVEDSLFLKTPLSEAELNVVFPVFLEGQLLPDFDDPLADIFLEEDISGAQRVTDDELSRIVHETRSASVTP